jgi:hypothetical protein
MDQAEISEMANAASTWLAYRSLTGFGPVLSEAMLFVPISEYLARTNWKLRPELSYRTLTGDNSLPIFSCDFVGINKFGDGFRWMLEAKYLKRDAEKMAKHIAADVVRLSMPKNKSLKRFFLLAGRDKYFPGTEVKCLFGKLFGLGENKGCYVKTNEAIENADFSKSFPIFGQTLKHAANLHIPALAYVTCRAISEISAGRGERYKVVIWSVARSSASEAVAEG